MTDAVTLDDHRLAATLAEEAGRMLLELRVTSANLHPALLKDEGDRQAHLLLAARLHEARPDDGLLSEEGVDTARRLSRERVWIVDPLDGTREYGEDGRSDWAVHVALAVRGVLVAGAVALPARGIVLGTDPAPPAPPPAPGGRLRVVTSRTRMPQAATSIAAALGAELLTLGSAGAKAMAVVLGEADAYAHAGGMYEWDSAAPAAVALAAGLHVSRIDGAPMRYNRPDPWLPDLLICRPELAATCLEALKHP